MRRRILAGWWLAAWLTLATPAVGVAQTFPDYDPSFGPPTGWTGRTFTLSQNYPAQLPPPETRPWEAIDFRQDALGYLQAVLSYALEGNTDIDFDVARNPVRTWYHTPWLHPNCFGREFVRGLTRERRSRAFSFQPIGERLA